MDFFISVALTLFSMASNTAIPVLSLDDYSLTWRYFSQAGALAVDDVDTRLIADAFEKVEKYKPPDVSTHR